MHALSWLLVATAGLPLQAIAQTPSFRSATTGVSSATSYATPSSSPQQGQYDYIICGAGSAGMLLGVVLSENPDVRVLVLEAGEDGRTEPNITEPENRGNIQDTKYDWAYKSLPQPGLYQNRSQPVPRGKTIGGTSAMNWMIHNEDSRVQLDIWESLLNLTGWNWESISTAFRESEHFYAPPADAPSILTYDLANHGSKGYINSTLQRSVVSIFYQDLEPALKAAGFAEPRDRNGGDSVGYGPFPLAITPETYTRSFSGSAYTVAQNRSNLKVMTQSQVLRINWQSSNSTASGDVTASGVSYVDLVSNTTKQASARKIVLSSGVIGSPQILEQSGVGNSSILNPLGIRTVVDLPNVGVGLRDPPMMFYEPLTLNFTHPVSGGEYVQNFIDLEPASKMLSPDDYQAASAWLNSTTSIPGLQDIQLRVFKKLWYAEQPIFEMAWQYSTAQVMPYNLIPLSQGTVHVNSSNPRSPPAIDPHYNSVRASINGTMVDWDMWLLAKASQHYLAQLATHAPTNQTMNATEPDWRLPFDDFYDAVVRRVGTSEHLTGGLPMLAREVGGVVDAGLKVYGTANVFVVDGSVFPYQPSAHPMGVTYAIAVRAARLFEGAQGGGGLTGTEMPAGNASASETASFGGSPPASTAGAAMPSHTGAAVRTLQSVGGSCFAMLLAVLVGLAV